MDFYKYPPSSMISDVCIVASENGIKRAYLIASSSADAEKLTEIKNSLFDASFQCAPALFHDKPALEVRGFRKEQQLLKYLKAKGFTSGEPSLQKQEEKSYTLWEKVQNRSLQASGLFYLLADACYATYGYKEGHWEDALAGVFYAGGSGTLFAYGDNNQSDLQVHDYAKSLEKHLASSRYLVPANCSLHSITKEHTPTFFQQVDTTFRRNTAEIFGLLTGAAGACIATSAYRHRVKGHPEPGMDAKGIADMRSEGWKDVGLGTSTILSSAVAGLVKEKKHDPDDAPSNGLNRVVEWVQEKPMRTAGYGYMFSTAMHAWSTVIAFKDAIRRGDAKRLQSVPFRAGFIGSTIIGEILTSISSKGHGDGVTSDPSVNESVYAIAAETILKQPAEKQEMCLQQVISFLENPAIFAEKRDIVEQKLRTQMASLQNNPWLCTDTPGVDTPGVDAPGVDAPPAKSLEKPALTHAKREQSLANWQQKVSTPHSTQVAATI